MTDPKRDNEDEATVDRSAELDDETVEDLTPPEDDQVQGGPTTPARICEAGTA